MLKLYNTVSTAVHDHAHVVSGTSNMHIAKLCQFGVSICINRVLGMSSAAHGAVFSHA